MGVGFSRIFHFMLSARFGHFQLVVTVLYWSDSDGLASTVAVGGQTSVCSANSRASSTSIPKYLTVLSSFV